jgi:hypothetical protein
MDFYPSFRSSPQGCSGMTGARKKGRLSKQAAQV